MNTNEAKQLQTLTTTVTRLEKVVGVLERRIKQLEMQNKKLHSAVIAAQTRISTLMSSMESVKSRINKQ